MTSAGGTPRLDTIRNARGLTATVLEPGANLFSVRVPLSGGGTREILPGPADPAAWSGRECRLELTGRGGIPVSCGRFRLVSRSARSLTYALRCPAAEDRPGAFDLSVIYSVGEDNTLYVRYLGKCAVPCRARVAHGVYFNLNGRHSSILNHTLWLDAGYFLPRGADLRPTGELRAAAGGAFDFTVPKTLGQDFMHDAQLRGCGGYDHFYLIKGDPAAPCARLEADDHALKLELFTDYPAVRLNSGTRINTPEHKIRARDDGQIYANQTALSLEPGFPPDCPPPVPRAALCPPAGPDAPLSRRVGFRFES